jgi:hypothetical protein
MTTLEILFRIRVTTRTRGKPGRPTLVGGSLIIGSALMIALAVRNAQPGLLPDIASR